jgi:hypothetical protein
MSGGHFRGHDGDRSDGSAKGRARRPSGAAVAGAVGERDHLNVTPCVTKSLIKSLKL